jgi:Skp family chaperone for outer membrane proteins
LDTELRNLELELNKPALTQANRENLVRQVEEKRVAMKRFAEDADKEVIDARNRELVALNARLMPVVEALSKEMGIAGVFNRYESGLVYSADAIDITDALIKRFNASTPAAAAPTTQPSGTQPPRTQATPRPQPSRRP